MSQAIQQAPEKITFSGLEEKMGELIANSHIDFPQNYSYNNAMKGAWLVLKETKDRNGNPALNVCSKTSIVMAMFEMVLKGLSVSKKQGYFIVYGNQLQFQESYHGKLAIVKRLIDVESISSHVIRKDEKFEFGVDPETGRKKLIRHEPSFDTIDNEILGAYAVIREKSGLNHFEVMSIADIRRAWNQGSMKGGSPAHKNFEGEMAKKSVISRLCKSIINTSDDGSIVNEDEDMDTLDRLKSTNQLTATKEVIEFEEEQEQAPALEEAQAPIPAPKAEKPKAKAQQASMDLKGDDIVPPFMQD